MDLEVFRSPDSEKLIALAKNGWMEFAGILNVSITLRAKNRIKIFGWPKFFEYIILRQNGLTVNWPFNISLIKIIPEIKVVGHPISSIYIIIK